jgi:hypothetical protein
MTPGVAVPAVGPDNPQHRVHLAIDRALHALIALSLAADEQDLLPVFTALADAAAEALSAHLRDTESALTDAIGHLLKNRADEARSSVIEARSTLARWARPAPPTVHVAQSVPHTCDWRRSATVNRGQQRINGKAGQDRRKPHRPGKSQRVEGGQGWARTADFPPFRPAGFYGPAMPSDTVRFTCRRDRGEVPDSTPGASNTPVHTTDAHGAPTCAYTSSARR